MDARPDIYADAYSSPDAQANRDAYGGSVRRPHCDAYAYGRADGHAHPNA